MKHDNYRYFFWVQISELCSGKTNILRCSVETVYKLAKALGVSMEMLVEDAVKLPNPSKEELYEDI